MADEISILPDLEGMPAIGPEGPGDPKAVAAADALLFKDSLGLKSGTYSKTIFRNIFAGARAAGVDPVQAAALAMQESGAGTAKVKGRRGKFAASLAQIKDFSDEQQAQVDQLAEKTGIDPEYLKLGVALRDKLDYAKRLGYLTEPEQLQAFNGYGTITPAAFGGATQAYGVDISQGVNLKKNPLYGKRVQQLKNDLLANEYIQSLLK